MRPMLKKLSKICLPAAVVILLLAAPITALADGGEDEFTQTVDGYQVTLVFEKPIDSGENQVHLRISDDQGQPVSNALVEVVLIAAEAEHNEVDGAAPEGDMHGMEGMSKNEPSHAANDTAHAANEPSHTPNDEHGAMGMAPFSAGHEAGEYAGEITVSGSGEWIFRVHLSVDGHELEVEFPLHVASAQTGKNILLGYLTINAVILGVAAVIKLRPAAA